MGQKNMWELLAISPTTDVVEIKKAFARQSKIYHPEEYPEEWKSLQCAYRKAIDYARHSQGKGFFKSEEAQEFSVTRELQESRADVQIEQQTGIQIREQIEQLTEERDEEQREEQFSFISLHQFNASVRKEQFFEAVQAILNNPYLRNNCHSWDCFLGNRDSKMYLNENGCRIQFLKMICEGKSLDRETLCYFEEWLQKYSDEVSEEWIKRLKKKKWKVWYEYLPLRSDVVDGWKVLHKRILKNIGYIGGNDSLEEVDKILLYHQEYFKVLAEDNSVVMLGVEQEQKERESKQDFITQCIVVVIAVLLAIISAPHLLPNVAENAALERKEERQENYQDDIDSILKDVSERYNKYQLETGIK